MKKKLLFAAILAALSGAANAATDLGLSDDLAGTLTGLALASCGAQNGVWLDGQHQADRRHSKRSAMCILPGAVQKIALSVEVDITELESGGFAVVELMSASDNAGVVMDSKSEFQYRDAAVVHGVIAVRANYLTVNTLTKGINQ